ncbi:hypothetical protein RJ639_042090 [Escallonia herrerae]|uniref:Zn-dependent metallo-hydrolase RNA specificity domain-containing protein n=1 Tax=Escallonia herrerae TaxID=1293975 RepID=A0AA88WGI0_9ASTE|nr:hypothetical protein RJ639_042090 [Escallonia herrerae]
MLVFICIAYDIIYFVSFVFDLSQIHQLSFSPHTDAKGIMDLVKFLSPKHVVLVHGEKPKMALLKAKIQAELGIPSNDPANNETVCISSTHYVKAYLSDKLIQTSLSPNFKFLKTRLAADCGLDSLNIKATSPLQLCDDRISEGILTMGKSQKAKVVHQDELLVILGDEIQEVQCANCFPVNMSNFDKIKSADELSREVQLFDKCSQLYAKLSSELPELNIQDCGEFLQVESFRASVCLLDKCPHKTMDNPCDTSEAVYFCCTWAVEDEKLAWKVISIMKNSSINAP